MKIETITLLILLLTSQLAVVGQFNCTGESQYSPLINRVTGSELIVSFAPSKKIPFGPNIKVLKGVYSVEKLQELYRDKNGFFMSQYDYVVFFSNIHPKTKGFMPPDMGGSPVLYFSDSEALEAFEERFVRLVEGVEQGNKQQVWEWVTDKLVDYATDFDPKGMEMQAIVLGQLEDWWRYDATHSGSYFHQYKMTVQQEDQFLNILQSYEESVIYLLEFSMSLQSKRIYQFYLDRLYSIHQQNDGDFDEVASLAGLLLHFLPKEVSVEPVLRLRLYHLAKNGLEDEDIYASIQIYPLPSELGKRQYYILTILASINQELNSPKLEGLIKEWKSVCGNTEQEFKAALPKFKACIKEAAQLLHVCDDEKLMALPEAKTTMRCQN